MPDLFFGLTSSLPPAFLQRRVWRVQCALKRCFKSAPRFFGIILLLSLHHGGIFRRRQRNHKRDRNEN